MNLQCSVQVSTDGLAQAFIIGDKFFGNHLSALVLGDQLRLKRVAPLRLPGGVIGSADLAPQVRSVLKAHS